MAATGSPRFSSAVIAKDPMCLPSLMIAEEAKTKPKRCCFDGCKKKLSLTDFACKCGDYHCAGHRPAEVHSCTFDFRSEQKNVLNKTMSNAIVANKVDKI